MCSGRSSGGISSACRGAVASRRGVSLALLASVWWRVTRSGRRGPQLEPDVDSSPAHRGRATDGSAGRGRNGRGGRGPLAATRDQSDGRSLRRSRAGIVSGPRRQAGSRADVLLRHDGAGWLPGLRHGPGGAIEVNGPRALDPQNKESNLAAKVLMVLSASIIFTLGVVHLVYTFSGPKLTPRDPALQISMSQISPVITKETTMWRAWVGFNASHSMGAILFGLVFGFLALAHGQLLF